MEREIRNPQLMDECGFCGLCWISLNLDLAEKQGLEHSALCLLASHCYCATSCIYPLHVWIKLVDKEIPHAQGFCTSFLWLRMVALRTGNGADDTNFFGGWGLGGEHLNGVTEVQWKATK